MALGLGLRTDLKCSDCKYKELNQDGGWCYMFKKAPTRNGRGCGQWASTAVPPSIRRSVTIPPLYPQ